MAKKTTKTAHVMNLLTKAEGSSDVEVNEENLESSPNLNQLKKENTKNKSISEQINSDLEALIEADEIYDAPQSQKITMPNEEVVIVEDAPKAIDGQNINEYSHEHFDKAPVTEEEHDPTSPVSHRTSDDYMCVNVMEDIVATMIDQFMDKFELCKCITCRTDVTALTLNALQPKYVGTYKGQLYTKLAAYEKQYTTDIVTALTRACIFVKSNPHH